MIARSRLSYDETLATLKDAIAQNGATIFVAIDQAAAAKSVGLTLRPTTLIVFGNPEGGTPLMEAFPLVGLDLPLKLLIWEADGAVNLAYVSVTEIAARYGVEGMNERIQAMDRNLEMLVASVT